MKTAFALFALAACLNTSSIHAAGDAERGKLQYAARCVACHSIDVNLAGPAHRGVFGAKAGSVPGFDYSPALRKSKVIWNERTLDKWLTNPERLIPGQKMGYVVADAKDRDDLIAYLRTQIRR